ncbi:MAG: DUF342 domain-containing protein [Candidatus Dadabacteria bacterium]|nr:MAG: DUF342 domain-containing protein [Candidatus Dadabacteria bacterium]
MNRKPTGVNEEYVITFRYKICQLIKPEKPVKFTQKHQTLHLILILYTTIKHNSNLVSNLNHRTKTKTNIEMACLEQSPIFDSDNHEKTGKTITLLRYNKRGRNERPFPRNFSRQIMKTVLAEKTEQFSLTAKTSSDKMKLFVDVERLEAGPIEASQITDILSGIVPAEMIHSDVVADIVKKLLNGEEIKERRVAKGKAPQPGRDGKLVLLVKPLDTRGNIQLDEKGYADYTKIHLFDNIAAGQEVARIYPPSSGTDGTNVLGESVKAAAGKPYKASLNKTLKVEPVKKENTAYDSIIAQIDGYLEVDGNRLAIKDELLVKGNLDYHYGSIDFNGTVKIAGDLMPGFHVKARDGVEIKGNIERGSVSCTSGDIAVAGTVIGGDNTRLLAGGSISVTKGQHMDLEALGDITVEKESFGSSIKTGGTLLAKNARIIGGIVRAVCGAEIKELGTSAGTASRVIICNDLEARSDYLDVLAQIGSHEKAMELIELHMGPFAKVPEKIKKLSGDHQNKMLALYEKLKKIRESLERLNQKREKLRKEARFNALARVNIIGKIYAGTSISIGDTTLEVQEERAGPLSIELSEDRKKLKFSEYKEIVCELEPINIEELP